MGRLALHDDDGFATYVAAIQQFQPLDRETELKLARRWKRYKDVDAANQLVQSHLRFVVKIANGYRGYGLRVADLVEEGAASFQRQLVMGDLASEYDNEIRVWLEELEIELEPEVPGNAA